MIIISHRPSLLNICDRHFQLENGVLNSVQFKPMQKNTSNSSSVNEKHAVNQ